MATATDIDGNWGADRLRLAMGIDVSAMQSEIAVLTRGDWTRHFVTQHFDGDWLVLPLRAPVGADHPILQIANNPGTKHWTDTPWVDTLPACADWVRNQCPGRVGAARLMALAPGSHIHEHRDAALSAADGMVRLHLPILTNDGVDFRLNGTRVVMAEGELWYLRLTDPHSVANRGGGTRIHLVVDTVPDAAFNAILAAAGGAA